MAPPRPPRVLLSCTPELARYPGDRSFAELAEDAVRRAGGQPLRLDGAWDARPEPPEVDLVVAVLGFRYGPTSREHPPVSVVEADLAEAERRGVPRLVVLLGEEVVGPAWLFADPETGFLQGLFRRSWAGRADAVVSGPGALHRAVLDGVRARVDRPPAAGARRLRRIPGPRDRFVDRPRLLDELDAGRGVQVLTGAAGTGKSWLAAEVAHRRRDEYDVVWWLSCSTPEVFPPVVAELAAALGVDPADDVVGALREHLRRSAVKALVVLDDLTDPKALDLVEGTRCDVLVTSRQDLPGAHRTLAVGPFDREESVRLLLGGTGWSRDEAHDLAGVLLDHPLTVAVAARHARHAGLSARGYRDRLREVVAPTRGSAALRLVLDDVFARDEKVHRLLTTAAQFGPEPVPFALFGEELGDLPGIADVIRWLDWFAPVEVEGQRFTLHPLLAEEVRTRARSAEEPPEFWVVRAMDLLAAAVSENMPFQVVTGIATHMPTVLRRSQEVATSADKPVELVLGMTKVAESLRAHTPALKGLAEATTLAREHHHSLERGRWQLVRDEARRFRDLHGEDDPRTLSATRDAVSALRELGLFGEALDLARTALPAHERAFGPSDAHTLAILNSVAALHRESGDLDEARRAQAEALSRAVAALGEEHEETLAARANLAGLLHEQGHFAAALRLDEDVLRATERLLGTSHPRTLAARAGVAADLLALDRPEEARALNEDVLRRSRRVLGPDHPDTLVAAGNLADSLAALGEDEAALRLDQETHERYRRVLGPDHPDTLLSANNLAAGLRALGRFAEAAEIDRTTAARLREVLGPDHPDARRSADNLALDLRLLEQEGGDRGERS
ncbi:tetratricopeptide repeat protein [Saccharothrix lopnurensis]|uniref:Tetratricopeptide repeat protein n=1 Tax=Saccharothrix lopnurensis TaxID=1670621 RepID=A0ABW1P8Z9_9PSEU